MSILTSSLRTLASLDSKFCTMNLSHSMTHRSFFPGTIQILFDIQMYIYFICDTRGYSIGDRIGLFPIAYADRVLYSSQRDEFREEEDLYIISETVNKVMLEMLTTLIRCCAVYLRLSLAPGRLLEHPQPPDHVAGGGLHQCEGRRPLGGRHVHGHSTHLSLGQDIR